LPLTLLFPIFVLTALGALLARGAWLRPGWHTGLTELTAKLLIPMLLLTSTYRTGMPAAVSWQVLCAFYLPLVTLFLLVAHGSRALGDSAPRALTSVYSNTAFVGIPVLLNVFGESRMQFAYPVIAFHSLASFTLYYLHSVKPDAEGTRGMRRVVRSLASAVSNPIVLSLFAGLGLNLAGVTLPPLLLRPLDMLASTALPCALLTLGASLVGLRMRAWAEPAAVAAIKLLLLPLCVLVLSAWVFHLPAQAQSVLVVLASCPVGINAAFVIGSDGKDTAMAGSAILLSSLACAATIPFWLWVIGLLATA